jgi:predicted  nucleic acid-binding Zn-ribbon protein
VRGGAYKSQTPAEKALKAVDAAAKAAAKQTEKAEKTEKEKETIADLRGQVAALKAELSAEKMNKELAVSAAKLEVEQRLAMDMLKRYQQGLRDGASLSAGHGMFGGSPASGFGSSPAGL